MHQVNDIFNDLDSKISHKVDAFHALLLKWNAKINLISRATVNDSIMLHIADGIYGARVIKDHILGNSIYDLGSGNGVPGVIFSILFPEIKVVAMDSDERKCAFLKHSQLDLDLINLEIINCRVENAQISGIQNFMARGFASISESNAVIDSKIEKGSIFYHFKATGWEKEIDPNCSTWNNFNIGSYELLPRNKEKVVRHIIKSEKLLM